MILLRTLGAFDVLAPDRPEASAVLAQPKRFALLVYLAVAARGEYIRRDTLLALFWPESDQEHGRRVLRQTIYKLRQSLGPQAITSRGAEELGVDPAVLSCDVLAFEEALAAGRTAEAIQSYRGDFLVGLHVPESAPELEEWIDAQRRRLRARATAAVWTLALAEGQNGNQAGAAYWARRALELDPLDESRVSDVMQLLASAGDRADALHVYAEYARRAAEDLGLQPGVDLQRQAESLRLAPDTRHGGERVAAVRIVSAEVLPSAVPATLAEARVDTRKPRRRILWAIPLAATLTVAAVVLRSTFGASVMPVVAVGPIVETGAPTSAQPSNVPADLLSTSLARLTGVQVIPVTRLYDVQSQLRAAGRPATSVLEAAKQVGADEIIQGVVREQGSTGVQLDLQVIDLATGAVKRAYRAQGHDLFAAIDEVTTAIALNYGVASPKQRIADVTTASLVAYRLYDQGLQSYYRTNWPAAYELFTAALAEDTAFPMAAYYAAVTAQNVDQRAMDTLVWRAKRLARRASDRERLFILASIAEKITMSPEGDALADTLAARYPLDPNTHLAAANAAVRRGDFMNAAQQYRRVIQLDSLSLQQSAGRCLACDGYHGLWWSYLYADSLSAAERVAREFARAQTGGGGLALLAYTLARQGRTTEAWQVWRTQDSLRAGSVNLDLSRALLAIRNGNFVDADERLRRLLHEAGTTLRSEAAWYLVLSLRTQGRHQEALRYSDSIPSTFARAIVLFEMRNGREAAAAFEKQIFRKATYPGHLARNHSWGFTHTATSLAAAGDTSRLVALADTVERAGKLSGFGRDPRLHHYIRGLLWNARGHGEQAAREFRASIWSWNEGYTRANYELARTLMALQRPREGLYPLQAALRGDLESSNLYVTRTELHELLAQLFDRLGMADSAAVHYSRVATAWQDADPQFFERRQFAARRLAALRAGARPTAAR